MLRFVTTADTEILATAAAVRRLPDDFPQVRCANPGGFAGDAAHALIDDVLDGAASCSAGSSAADVAGQTGSTRSLRRPAASATSCCSPSAARPSRTPR